MKIRLGELRRIIREVVGGGEELAAAVMTSGGGGAVVVYKPDVLAAALRGGESPEDAVVGHVRLIDMTAYCGAWEISEMWGPGYGDMLIDVAFTMSPGGKLVMDRRSVSVAAEKLWSRTAARVEVDDMPPSCKTSHDRRPGLKKIYSSPGDRPRLEAMEALHRDVMAQLSSELGKTQEVLETVVFDAGWEKFNGSLEW